MASCRPLRPQRRSLMVPMRASTNAVQRPRAVSLSGGVTAPTRWAIKRGARDRKRHFRKPLHPLRNLLHSPPTPQRQIADST